MKKTKQKIYIFGNPLLDFDNLPLKLKPELEKALPEIDFIEMDPNENLHPENKKLIIIDTIINSSDVTIIEDIDKLESSPSFSMHDLDLTLKLKLLKKIGGLKKVKIIGVPANGNKNKTLCKIIKILKNNR